MSTTPVLTEYRMPWRWNLHSYAYASSVTFCFYIKLIF